MTRNNNLAVDFFVSRETADRRIGTVSHLPYLTEDGLVLFERRESDDRRRSQRNLMNNASAAPRLTDQTTLTR